MPKRVLLLMVLTAWWAGCGGAQRTGEETTSWPGRLHRLTAWGWGAPALLVNVPDEYAPGMRAGEDFIVHLFRRPPEVAPPDTATLGIYIGHRPRDLKEHTMTEPGRIAGRDVTWHGSTWTERGQPVLHAEAYVKGVFTTVGIWRPSVRSLVVHVFAWGTDQEEVENLIRACESIRLDGS